MKASEIKKLLAEPNVERIELRPDGTVIVYANQPLLHVSTPVGGWPHWARPYGVTYTTSSATSIGSTNDPGQSVTTTNAPSTSGYCAVSRD